MIHRAMAKSDSALMYSRLALSLAREIGDRSAEARALANYGGVFVDIGANDSALVYSRAALPMIRALSDSLFEAGTLSNIGTALRATAHPDSALEYYLAAFKISAALRDRNSAAVSAYNMANVLFETGQIDSVMSLLRTVLSVSTSTANRGLQAKALDDIGKLFLQFGEPDSALAYIGSALSITRALGDRRSEVGLLATVGSIYHRTSRADSALSYYRAALALARDIGDRAGGSLTLNAIGLLYRDMGQPDSAFDYMQSALTLKREIKDRSGEGTVLNNIGLLYWGVGQTDSALTYFQAALPIKVAVADRSGEAILRGNIGLVYSDLRNPDSALAYHRASLAIARSIGDRTSEGTTLSNIGAVYHVVLHQPDSALKYYREALPIRRAVGDNSGVAMTLSNLGDTYGAIGQSARALALLDSSMAVFAKVRLRTGNDASAVAFAEQQRSSADLWVITWLRMAAQSSGGVTSALGAAERGRAQGLRDLLARSGVTAGPNANDMLWARDTVPGANLTDEAEQALAPLRRARSAALYYFLGGDTLTTWLLTPAGTLSVASRIAVRGDSVAALVRQLRAALGADAARTRMARGEALEQERVPARRIPNEQAQARGVEDEASAESKARLRVAMSALGALLLPSALVRELPAGSDLVIVPHGILGLVPFAALTARGDTVPLGARYALRYAPSLRALGAAEGRAPGWTSAVGHVLVVGDPAMPSVRGVDGRSVQLKDLPSARSEGEAVARRFRASALTSQAATETVVRAALPSAPLVHLATHGLAYGTEVRVRDSYVALAPDAKNDGLLTIGELLDDVPSLAADLVVLSACQTGLGDLKQAEGTVGFQRALLAKGARSVLVSLWSVDDRATALLMQRFYEHWLGADGRPARSKGEALRQAQADVRLTRGFESPRYWAAFQLVGAR
jgi:CHAT domain-containing protein/tetratricopeptide (TPR) repeat protein